MSALDLFIAAVNANAGDSPESQLIAAKCRALGAGYDARWSTAPYLAVDVERMLTARMTNPDTGRPSRELEIAGKLDLIAARSYGRRCLFDHKTTSQDIADPDAPYWRQLAIEGQVSHYALLLWMHGEKVDEIVWDVIRKPSISPKKLTKAEAKAVLAFGEYCDQNVSQQSLDDVLRDERETVEMYEARLVRDCTKERPEWYFQRRNVPRLDSEILDYAAELWDHGQDLLAARQRMAKSKRLPPRNYKSCMAYGSPCKFLGICSGYDSPDSRKWQRKGRVHNELQLEGDGRNTLTTSRVSCFQSCRRKHYYEYELGIERVDEEEREALFFGHLIHVGLNAWWSFYQEKSNVYGSTGSRVSEARQPATAEATVTG